MSFKKNMMFLGILGSTLGMYSCAVCEHKNDITLYPHNIDSKIRFPLNKGEASVGITLSYSLSEQRDCELRHKLGRTYANELIMGHACQIVGEQLQHKPFNNITLSQEQQEKKATKELSDYFSCFDIHIFSVKFNNLKCEKDCILTPSSVLAPYCYDYTGFVKERE